MKDRGRSCVSTGCMYAVLIAAATAACVAILLKLESASMRLHAHARGGVHTLQHALADAAAAATLVGSVADKTAPKRTAVALGHAPSAADVLQSWLATHTGAVDRSRELSWFEHVPKQASMPGWNTHDGKPPPRPRRSPAPAAPASSHTDAVKDSAADPFFGAAADVTLHRENHMCWNHFDFGMLDDWDARARVFCAPRGEPDADMEASAAKGSPLREQLEAVVPIDGSTPSHRGWLVCRVMSDAHLPGPTAPHTMCDGANIVFDFNRMTPSQCPANRPGYKCDGSPVFYNYASGALQAECARRGDFNNFAFPRDHLMDIFASFDAVDALQDELAVTDADAPVTLFVTRERGEHANLFHASTDFMNAFYTLHVAGIIDGLSGSRVGMDDVQVVLLDEQLGPFDDPFWHTVFSPRHAVQRPSTLARVGSGRTRFRRALFVPPGYTNVLLAHVLSEGDCHAATHAFQAYRKFVLAGMRIPSAVPHAEGDVTVTFVSRRPYNKFVDHAFIGRQISNEDDVLLAMAAVPRVRVERVDLALMEVDDQLTLIVNTDLLVGMHGAALTYATYLPPYAGVLELWPSNGDIWRCFEHISAMSGMHYVRWENNDPGSFYKDDAGDYTRVDIGSFVPMFRGAVDAVLRRRIAAADAPPP